MRRALYRGTSLIRNRCTRLHAVRVSPRSSLTTCGDRCGPGGVGSMLNKFERSEGGLGTRPTKGFVALLAYYRATSLMRNRLPVGLYGGPMPLFERYRPPCVTELPVFVGFIETDHLHLEGRSRQEVSSQLILSGCTYEAQMNLLWTPHNLASLFS